MDGLILVKMPLEAATIAIDAATTVAPPEIEAVATVLALWLPAIVDWDTLEEELTEELEEVELEVVEEEFSNLSICFFNSLKSDLSFDNLFFVFVFVLEKDSFKEITSSEDSAFSNV